MLNTIVGKGPRQTVKRALAKGHKLMSAVPGINYGSDDASVRILMYHSIHPDYSGSVTPDMFERQMAVLASEFRPCPLDEFSERMTEDAAASPKTSVVVTFDDGYQDVLRFALPILEHYGIPASIFICTRYVHENQAEPAPPASGMYRGLDVLTWPDLEHLVNSELISFGSHTHSHVQLRGLSAKALKEEIETPKHLLESRLGVNVRSFAYPWGQRFNFDKPARDAIASGGFDQAVSTVWGPATKDSDQFVLPRIRIDNVDNILDFSAKLRGEWDYVAYWQHLNGWTKGLGN